MENEEVTVRLEFPPDAVARAEQASAAELPVMQQAATLVIVDQETADVAGETFAAIRKRRRRIKEEFRDLRQAANDAAAKALALERKADAPWAAAEVLIKAEIERWDDVCERRRIEAERVAQAERARLQEQARQEAEAERARLQAEEDARQLALAAKAEAAGDAALAARIIEAAPVVVMPEPVAVPLVPVALAPQARVPGAAIRRPWKYILEDPTKVVRAFLIPDEKAIAAIVKTLGMEAVAVVGIGAISVYQDRTVAGAGVRKPKADAPTPAEVVVKDNDTEDAPW